MKVRVSQGANVAAACALIAGGRGTGAKQPLGYPKRQPLFSDPSRTVQEEAGWEAPGVDTLRQPFPQRFVSVNVDERHISNMANAYRAWHVF